MICGLWQPVLSFAKLMTHLQVCEVQLAISQGTSTTWVTAALTPDGNRSHKIGGKQKPAKDVKVSPGYTSCSLFSCLLCEDGLCCPRVTKKAVQEFLRDRSINLDSACSVIRQAQVTALADTNCALLPFLRSVGTIL